MPTKEPKAGRKSTEVLIAATSSTALAAGLASALSAAQETAALGCALGLGFVGGLYCLARGMAKGGK